MTEPADEIAAGQGHLRASHAEREQVVDALQAAFVQGRLTADELDERVGQALAARTYAELAALTTDLPADPDQAPAPVPAPSPASARRPQNPVASRAVKAGAGAIGATVIAASVAATVVSGQPAAGVIIAVFMLVLAAAATAVVATIIRVALKLESRQRNHPRDPYPPGPESGESSHPARPARARGADPAPPPHPPHPPHRLLATGLAG
jgi:hypothetical protein